MTLNYNQLKTRQRAERDNHPVNLALRVHRALSWLNRAEQCAERDDSDGQFIFLWIAFNAAYASEFANTQQFTEKKVFLNFFKRITQLDTHQRLYELIWNEFPQSIRLLLDNKYVFQPFWDFQTGAISKAQWMEQFKRAKISANKALAKRDTVKILAIIFNRLYTLRNQLMHGGATWNSSANRDQIRDGSNLLRKIIPMIIEIMLDNPKVLWGEPSYPVVEE